MENLFTNAILFVALCVALSGFTACTNTAGTQKGQVADVSPTASNTANSAKANDSADTKNTNYPPAPSVIMQTALKDLEGGTFKIEDKKGKVVLINLWATWCGPCRAEMPDLIALQDKYKDKNFEIIGLDSDDESVEEVKEFAGQMKLNYQLGFADGKVLSEFIKITRLQGIPQTMIINREGKMILALGGGGVKNVNSIKETVEKAVNE